MTMMGPDIWSAWERGISHIALGQISRVVLQVTDSPISLRDIDLAQ
jgi:hypothetical protein